MTNIFTAYFIIKMHNLWLFSLAYKSLHKWLRYKLISKLYGYFYVYTLNIIPVNTFIMAIHCKVTYYSIIYQRMNLYALTYNGSFVLLHF